MYLLGWMEVRPLTALHIQPGCSALFISFLKLGNTPEENAHATHQKENE